VIAGGRLVEVGTPETIGGRATAATRVSFTGPAGPETIQTDTPTATVVELAARFAGEIPDLTISRPTLEDIYLELIGAHA
jgi:ABC-2 type transport system ATP-binding protein